MRSKYADDLTVAITCSTDLVGVAVGRGKVMVGRASGIGVGVGTLVHEIAVPIRIVVTNIRDAKRRVGCNKFFPQAVIKDVLVNVSTELTKSSALFAASRCPS